MGILLILVLLPLAALLVWALFDKTPIVPDNEPTIEFESFKKFYSINPDRWILEDGYVVCKIGELKESYYYGRYFHDYKKQKFYFASYSGFRKYKKFQKKLEQDKLEVARMKATSEMLNMVKQDIANMETLAEQQQQQAKENFNKILNNLGGIK